MDLLFLRGKEAADNGNFGYAIAIFLDILKVQPDHLNSARALRGCEMQMFEGKGGSAKIAAFFKGLPNTILAFLPTIKAGKAVQSCENYLVNDPTNAMMLRRAAKLYEKLRYLDTAADTLEFARQRHPHNVAILYQLGGVCEQRNDFEKAVRCFQEITRLKPNDREAGERTKQSSAKWHLERSHMKGSKDFTASLADKAEATKLQQEGRVARTEDEKDARVAAQKKALEEKQEDPVAWRDLGQALFEAERYTEAEEAFKKEFKLSSREEARWRIGDARRRRLLQLEHRATQTAEENGKDPGLVGKAEFARRQRLDFCIKEWEFRRDAHPTDLRLAWELGNHYFERAEGEDIDKAIEQFQKSVGAPGIRSQSQLMLARAFARNLKTLDMAKDLLLMALEELGDLSLNIGKEITYELAAVAEKQGDKPAASASYKKIYAVDAGFKDVARKIRELA